MRKFAYVYQNTLRTKDPKREEFYEGEKIVNKTEEIKFEDDIGNVAKDTKCYITNFRIVTLSDKYIFDIPLCYIKTHYVKKPLLIGSNYIYLEFYTGLNFNITLPNYIQENIPAEELANARYQLPKYVMIKFRSKESNIDQSYNLLKLALNGKEWNNSYRKGIYTTTQEQQPQKVHSVTPQVGGLGLERTKNIIMNQLNEQNQMISGSFADIQSLKTNAKQMIDLSQQIKSKLSKNLNDDPAMSEINQVLTKIGFVDPVTKETSGKSYFIDLARQIVTFFTDYFRDSELGILSLIDAYCIYNRSRGMSTISPGDMKLALDQLSKTSVADQGIVVRVFKNDMVMIHTKDFSLENILEKLKHYLNADHACVTLKEFTEVTKTKNQLLSKILIEEMTDKGLLVIDESDLELRYFLNKILQYKF